MTHLLSRSRGLDRRARRAVRDRRARLLAELAGYRTQSERAELEMILARHSDDDAAPVRALIG